MLTKKQEIFLNLIINYYKTNESYPTTGELVKLSEYKSYDTIRKYLHILESKNYIKLDDRKKRIIYIKDNIVKDDMIKIPFINKKEYFSLSKKMLKDNKKYVAIRLPNNKLNSLFLKNGDILIIEKSKIRLDNKLVLVKIDGKYHVLKYNKKDGFIHLFSDKNYYLLKNNEPIIGKVVLMFRFSMD